MYGLASGAALPAAALWALASPRLRGHWSERIGWTLPAVEPGALWLHAASLGEGQAAAAVAAGISTRWPDLPLLRTATSETGRAQVLPVDDVRCLPLDAPWLQRRFVRRVRPRALVLVEGELWPGLLMACAGRVPVTVLGLRVGEGTRRLARRFPGLWRWMMATVASWSARDEEGAAWLREQLGMDVPVVGDLKLEAPAAPATLRFERPLLIAGSTRPGDEDAVLAAHEGLRSELQLVLAPRHGERIDEVARLLDERAVRWARRSDLDDDRVPADVDVLLLDTVGELAGLYPHAQVAFVGGTFDRSIGGHSAAEAARAGVPVVHGPEIHANAPSFAAASALQADSPGALGAALGAALAAPRLAPAQGHAVAGALVQLEPLVSAPVPDEGPHRPLARVFVPAYRLAARWRARRPRAAAPLPVIGVGNIASGGTGKTPVVRAIAQRLLARGLRVAVVSRGYGRGKGPWLRASDDGSGTAVGLGDELAMLAADGLILVSCPDRHAGVQRAAELGAQVCLLDDASQQRDVRLDLEIITVDARSPLAGGGIPGGELREPPEALARAAVVWSNHGALPLHLGSIAADAVQVQARMVPVGWLHRGAELPLEQGPAERVVALAGIAAPGGFLRQLRRLGLVPVQRHIHADHAWFLPAELAELRRLAERWPVVTTEKDLTRLPEDLEVWALRVELRIEQGEDALATLLSEFLAKHQIGEAP